MLCVLDAACRIVQRGQDAVCRIVQRGQEGAQAFCFVRSAALLFLLFIIMPFHLTAPIQSHLLC